MLRVVVYVINFVKQILKQMQTNKKHTKGTKPMLFHEKWLKAYGLRVTARDAATGSICSVAVLSRFWEISECVRAKRP